MLRVAEHFEQTDTGRQRRANEDSLFARAPVFAVADGMGGAQAGEVASRIAVEAFGRGLPEEGSPEERLAAAAREANGRINAMSRSERDRAGMGTTLTAVYVGEEEVSIAHVGDSRAYLLRGGELRRLTRDHSLVQALIDQRKLTEEEAAEHPQRSIITRALGPEADVEVDTRTLRGRPGDVVLICSDGLTSMVGEDAVGDVLRASSSLEEAGRRLIDAANEAGGRDNITVVLFRLEDVDRAGAGAPSGATDGDQDTSSAPALPAPPAAPPERRAPRPAAAPVASRRRRRVPRKLIAAVTVVLVAGVLVVAGWLASRGVYFVGTDRQGIVTVYRGLPYDLPFGVRLYERFYASGVPAATIPGARRGKLLDHKLRSQRDAESLVNDLELGKLAR
ncbi:MAG: family protein phosphatase [Solirubrobacteraceae bacterium]|jgi:protein phosphatase|nr:family protein phosphatase [Solirubrobacteraceae bacterium]